MTQRNCVVCGSAKAMPFFFVQQRGVPHGKTGHNVAHDYKVILVCEKCGCGQIEVYSHDCWSHEEPWEMLWWYAFQPAGVEAVKYLMQDCPAPSNPSCECDIHQFMRHQLGQIHSGIPHARSERDAQKYCWLYIGLNKEDNSVYITIDKSKEFGTVAQLRPQ